jgi:hypothetical protein
VLPGRPVTFLGDGCQVVVGREDLTFDVTLTGSLTSANERAVRRVLEAIVAGAQAINLSLGRLAALDAAGAAMLEEIAATAARTHVVWGIVDGSLAWQVALNRQAPDPAVAPPPARRRWARPVIAASPRPPGVVAMD